MPAETRIKVDHATATLSKIKRMSEPAPAPIKFRVTFQEEKTDHDGYCSDNECTYSSRVYTKIVTFQSKSEIPKTLAGFAKFADPVVEACNQGGSGYCGLSDEAKDAGLINHDSRITVSKIQKLF